MNRLPWLFALCLSASVSATDMKILGGKSPAGSLGTLDGWAAFGILEQQDLVWLSRNAGSSQVKILAEALPSLPKVLKGTLQPSADISENWLDLQDDFEIAADAACEQSRQKTIMQLKAKPLFPGLGSTLPEESAISVVKVNDKGALESAPVRCADPKGRRLKMLFLRSTVLLAYAGAAEATQRIKSQIPDKSERNALEAAVLRQVLKVFQLREAFFRKESALNKNFHIARDAMGRRLKKKEGRAAAAARKEELDPGDWKRLGL